MSDMTDEEMRVKIAEACGWKHQYSKFWGREVWKDDNGFLAQTPAGLPDYLNSLDAIHEAEKVLTDDQQLQYIQHLLKIEEPECPTLWSLSWDSAFHCAHATARTRCLAFLQVLNHGNASAAVKA